MKAIKYVFNSEVYENLIITKPEEIYWLFMEYLRNGGTSWSHASGRKTWSINFLNLSELTVAQAKELMANLHDLKEVAGIEPEILDFYCEALADCRRIIYGKKARDHMIPNGIVIEYKEFDD